MQYFPPVFSAVFSAGNFRRYFLQYFPPLISAGIFCGIFRRYFLLNRWESEGGVYC
jgi:hypothetical protein